MIKYEKSIAEDGINFIVSELDVEFNEEIGEEIGGGPVIALFYDEKLADEYIDFKTKNR